MVTLNEQQLAELLVRKCAIQIVNCTQDEYNHFLSAKLSVNNVEFKILQSIPLVELLICIKFYRDICKDLAINTEDLSSLDTKLKQILGEQV